MYKISDIAINLFEVVTHYPVISLHHSLASQRGRGSDRKNHEAPCPPKMSDASYGEKLDEHKPEPASPSAGPHDYLDAVEGGHGVSPNYKDNGHLNIAQRWVDRLESLAGLEARGVERVPEEARARMVTTGDYLQMAMVWFSVNLTANNLTIGILGPATFYLGLKDAMWIAFFGSLTGSAFAAYISTFGPISGNRTLV